MPDKRQYTYAPRGTWWGVWNPNGQKIEEYITREEARNRVYKLNGWGEPKPEKPKTMLEDQFIVDVRLMRKWQKEYFQNRSSEALRYAKNMEKRIDEHLDKFDQAKEKKSNPKLF